MAACRCAEFRQRAFDCVENAVYMQDRSDLQAESDTLVSDSSTWTALHRCRHCGSHWVDVCSSSGPMDICHLIPVPEGEDPERWMREEAKPLPFAKWL